MQHPEITGACNRIDQALEYLRSWRTRRFVSHTAHSIGAIATAVGFLLGAPMSMDGRPDAESFDSGLIDALRLLQDWLAFAPSDTRLRPVVLKACRLLERVPGEAGLASGGSRAEAVGVLEEAKALLT